MKKMIMLLLLLSGVLLGPGVGRAQTDSEPAAGEAAEATEAAETDESARETAPASGRSLSEQRWDEASTAYLNGDCRAAAEAYEALVAEGLGSAKLYYNLANACFKENRLGEAILYYRRALRIDPGDDDARYNLSVAEARTKDKIEQVPEFFLAQWFRNIRRTMGCTAWSICSLVMLACGLILFLVGRLAQRMSLRRIGRYGTLVAALLFVLTTGFAIGERDSLLDRSEAVVMASSASVKSAPDAASTDLFLLHEGTVVQIADRLDRWCQVTIADGKKGWIEADKIEPVYVEMAAVGSAEPPVAAGM